MTITELRSSGGAARVAITGDVNASDAEQLRVKTLDAATGHGAQLEVDLAEVTSMDRSEARAIADAFVVLRPSGSGLVLCKVPRQVQRTLETTYVGPHLEVSE
jgi:anti-anti-sigma factor